MKKIMVGAVVVIILCAAGVWFWQQVRIDRCLDQGGGWNPEEGVCVK
jgi:hypothetical protein